MVIDVRATWTSQSPTLPEFQWVVLDYGVGSDSSAFSGVMGEDSVFFSGSMGRNMTMTNAQTGASLFANATTDSEIFIGRRKIVTSRIAKSLATGGMLAASALLLVATYFFTLKFWGPEIADGLIVSIA